MATREASCVKREGSKKDIIRILYALLITLYPSRLFFHSSLIK